MRYDFQNQSGETLAGRLEMPDNQKPTAFALFAHCFTCSKDIIAPTVIAKTLAEAGIAVLRFDFTGLGNSAGDFANTNFSSNIQDLEAAFNSLKKDYEAPTLLIGHSLGGAAVLKAATHLSEVKAVATLAAPSSVAHVTNLFENDIPKINEKGEAEVNLAGRKFTIKKQLIKDLEEVDLLAGIRHFKKALLIMHAPLDNTVSVDHAAQIFGKAQHPKSFVSLDDADHLLMNRKDAKYAAEIIRSWVGRYI